MNALNPKIRAVRTLSYLGLAVLLFACLSRFAASLAWPLDLLANVSHFFCLPALFAALMLLWCRRWVTAIVLFSAGLTAIWPLFPSPAARAAAQAPSAGQPSCSLLLANVQARTHALRNLLPVIEREDPDLVLLIECGGRPMLELLTTPTLQSRFPFAVVPEQGLMWQVVILSRFPLRSVRFESATDPRFLQLFAHRRSVIVDLPDSEPDFLFSGVHPPSPRTSDSWRQGNETISLLAELLEKHMLPAGRPILIAGDFNSSASGSRHAIMDSSGLRPLDDLAALPGTWPACLPSPARLTLDRAWASDGITFTSRAVLGDVGSDHLPVLIRFTVPRR